MHLTLRLAWQLLLLPALATALCLDECQQAESSSLQLLYNQTAGYQWNNSNGWATSTDYVPEPHCSWYGVTCCSGADDTGLADTGHGTLPCDSPGAVTALILPRNNLQGELSRDVFANLQHLQAIDMSGNRLEGTLPEELASAPNLIFVNLAKNQISGSIPPALIASDVIRTIQMDDNLLTGTLPPMVQATTLTFMSLAHNKITGAIPEDWLSNKALYLFDLQFNQLTGTIPAGGLADDQWLYDNIALMGAFELRLRSNQLVGDLPQALSFLPLEIIDVGANNLTGGIGTLLSNTPFLRIFHVDENLLDGTIPDSFATFSLREFHIQGNTLTGTIPESLVKQQALISLRLDDNPLSGTIPEGLGSLAQLGLFTAVNTTLRGSTSRCLPSFLTFDTAHYYDTTALLQCPAVVANASLSGTLQTMQLDPYYSAYESCHCRSGYVIRRTDNTSMPVCIALPGSLSTRAFIGIAVGAALVLVAMVLAAIFMGLRFWQRLEAFAWKRAKLRGPPGQGKPLTLVATDIESSTELWEWNPAIADAAIRQHDQLMRTHILKHYGHELTTEGDAFIIAFWEPADAARFCIAVQKALMGLSWPKALLRFAPTAPSTLAGMSQQALKAVSPEIQAVHFADSEGLDELGRMTSLMAEGELLFVGLRVRMSITTGKAELASLSVANGESSPEISSPRLQYSGEVSQAVKALSHVTHGGQVLLDSATMLGLGRSREDILREFSLLLQNPAEPKRSCIRTMSVLRPSASVAAMDIESSVASHVPLVPVNSLELQQDRGDVSSRPSLELQRSKAALESPGRRSSIFGGEELDSQELFGADTQLMILHMGLHMLEGFPGIVQLYQLVLPTLEERARVLAPLKSREQLGAGYLDAPAAPLACLHGPQRHLLLPPVTMVFCAVDHAEEIKAAHPVQFQQMLTAYRYCIRHQLALKKGYECQEESGDFMLVFESPVQAVNFCIQVQEALLYVHWEPDILLLQHCCPVFSPVPNQPDCLLYAGPRVRMGIYEGVPSRIQPHTTSGRADYFGRLVNRAARFCHAASHGGQVTAPYDLIQRVIRTWTGNTARLPSGAEMHGQPLHVQVPEKTDPGLLPWQAPALSSSHGASGSRNVQSALRLRYNSRDQGLDCQLSGAPVHGNQGSCVAAALYRFTAEGGLANHASPFHAAESEATHHNAKREVYIRHFGDMSFKGVPGIQKVVDITSYATSRRVFPALPSSSKSKLICAGTGLLYVIEQQLSHQS